MRKFRDPQSTWPVCVVAGQRDRSRWRLGHKALDGPEEMHPAFPTQKPLVSIYVLCCRSSSSASAQNNCFFLAFRAVQVSKTRKLIPKKLPKEKEFHLTFLFQEFFFWTWFLFQEFMSRDLIPRINDVVKPNVRFNPPTSLQTPLSPGCGCRFL